MFTKGMRNFYKLNIISNYLYHIIILYIFLHLKTYNRKSDFTKSPQTKYIDKNN